MKNWIRAFRLRTLPLAASGIIAGNGMAAFYGRFSWPVFALSLLTAILLQVLSNLANDYGDASKGTDNEFRLGPQRMVQSGFISRKEMKTAIIIFSLLSLMSGTILIYIGLGNASLQQIIVFALLGMMAILAAIFYTIGKKAYGYYGLGDIFVILFFGLLAVYGSYYLQLKVFNYSAFLPALSIGFLSAGVLNCNNMRDIDNDRNSNKRTIAVLLGIKNAKIYHYSLVCCAWILIILFTILHYQSLLQFLFVLSLPLFLQHLIQVKNNQKSQQLDPQLKKLSLSTLLFSILFAVGMLLG